MHLLLLPSLFIKVQYYILKKISDECNVAVYNHEVISGQFHFKRGEVT